MQPGSVRKRAANVFISFLALLFITGCLGPKQQGLSTIYYAIDYVSPVPEGLPPLQSIILVNNFSISPNYNSTRIIYGEGNFIRNTYDYHQWQANPADMTTFLLSRDMRASGLFQGVFGHGPRIKPSHTINGIVSQFYEKDGKENWQAVLGLDITLLRNEPDRINKTVLFQKSYFTTRTCAKKTPASFVEAMSAAMRELSEKITLDIYKSIQEAPIQ